MLTVQYKKNFLYFHISYFILFGKMKNKDKFFYNYNYCLIKKIFFFNN